MNTLEIIAIAILIFIVVIIIAGYVTMLLWNWLMPEIFNLTEINFLQAIGLILLSSIFFYRPSSISK